MNQVAITKKKHKITHLNLSNKLNLLMHNSTLNANFKYPLRNLDCKPVLPIQNNLIQLINKKQVIIKKK